MLDLDAVDPRCRRLVAKLGNRAQKVRIAVTAEALTAMVLAVGERSGGHDASQRREATSTAGARAHQGDPASPGALARAVRRQQKSIMFEGFERKLVSVAGTEIACAIGGSGPPVLMLHGFPQNLAMWARVAPALAAHFTVVCADLRGYGGSAKPECLPDRSNYAFRALADDQVGLMRRLGFARFHVVGHDRGGRTGHRMALDHADAVLTLTVMDIVPTHAMFMDTNRHIAGAYWHWYFLSQPEPFPERLIGNDADFFYETCLRVGGRQRLPILTPKCSTPIAVRGAIQR